MGDCIPSSDFGSVSTMPAAAKNPIIGLSVVFSVVVVVAVVVVVILVRKLMQLKKLGADASASLKGYGTDISSEIDVKGKLPDLDVHRPNLSVDVSADAKLALNKAVEVGGNIKAGLKGAINAEWDIGLDLDSPFYVIFNAIPYASVLVDKKGLVVKANPACRAKWGYSASADLEGKLYKNLVAHAAVDARLDLIDAVFKGKKPNFEVDSFDLKVDGTEVEVEVLGSLVNILGKAYVFIITGHVCFDASGRRYKDAEL